MYIFDDETYITRSLENYHIWTLDDAKEGDILAWNQTIFIFNRINNGLLNYHCLVYPSEVTVTRPNDLITSQHFREVYPATKEQKDYLFTKLEKSGYMWDSKTKQLIYMHRTKF